MTSLIQTPGVRKGGGRFHNPEPPKSISQEIPDVPKGLCRRGFPSRLADRARVTEATRRRALCRLTVAARGSGEHWAALLVCTVICVQQGGAGNG